MGVLSFLKEAGEKLLHSKEASKEASVDSIKEYIRSQGLSTEGLEITFDPEIDRVAIAGEVPDQATKEKLLLCCGNVQGVSSVEDHLKVAKVTPESQFYTVRTGDTLSKIAARFYGDAKKYNIIFEANRPMLSNPDRIYPGQSLRIPPVEESHERVTEHHP